MFTLPSEAYLFFEGRLLKTDGSSYADTDAVTLTHNGIMHLFNNITYSLSNTIIESVTNTGQATTMFGMLKYDFQLAQGQDQLWVKDSGIAASLTENNGFAIRQSDIIQNQNQKVHILYL